MEQDKKSGNKLTDEELNMVSGGRGQYDVKLEIMSEINTGSGNEGSPFEDAVAAIKL